MKSTCIQYRRLFVIGLLSLGVFALPACNGTGTETSFDSEGSITYPVAQKIYLEEATLEDVANHVATCPNKKSFCVHVCHRPPGNPDNSKDMLLPLKASHAHLHHGNAKHERDYLGFCQPRDMEPGAPPGPSDDPVPDDPASGGSDSNDSGSDDVGSDDAGSGSDAGGGAEDGGTSDSSDPSANPGTSDGSGATDGSSSTNEDIPFWCEPIIDIDSDCDGYIDETGEPLF